MGEEREWVTQPDNYTCSLSAETQEIAKLELREEPKERNHALESLRQWIVENPKILNCRLGMIITSQD